MYVQHGILTSLTPLAARISKVRSCRCPREDNARLVDSQVSLLMSSIASYLGANAENKGKR